MLEACDLCGSSVIEKLLRCSDEAAVVHRECEKGHKQHRIIGRLVGQRVDSRVEPPSSGFVMIEPCDCN